MAENNSALTIESSFMDTKSIKSSKCSNLDKSQISKTTSSNAEKVYEKYFTEIKQFTDNQKDLSYNSNSNSKTERQDHDQYLDCKYWKNHLENSSLNSMSNSKDYSSKNDTFPERYEKLKRKSTKKQNQKLLDKMYKNISPHNNLATESKNAKKIPTARPYRPTKNYNKFEANFDKKKNIKDNNKVYNKFNPVVDKNLEELGNTSVIIDNDNDVNVVENVENNVIQQSQIEEDDDEDEGEIIEQPKVEDDPDDLDEELLKEDINRVESISIQKNTNISNKNIKIIKKENDKKDNKNINKPVKIKPKTGVKGASNKNYKKPIVNRNEKKGVANRVLEKSNPDIALVNNSANYSNFMKLKIDQFKCNTEPDDNESEYEKKNIINCGPQLKMEQGFFPKTYRQSVNTSNVFTPATKNSFISTNYSSAKPEFNPDYHDYADSDFDANSAFFNSDLFQMSHINSNKSITKKIKKENKFDKFDIRYNKNNNTPPIYFTSINNSIIMNNISCEQQKYNNFVIPKLPISTVKSYDSSHEGLSGSSSRDEVELNLRCFQGMNNNTKINCNLKTKNSIVKNIVTNNKTSFKKGDKIEINLDDIASGKDTTTTVMIRNIPIKYTDELIIEALEEFKGKFNCFYMPYDFNKNGNRGYAFINFINPLHILYFYEKFNHKKWKYFDSMKICELNAAHFQGISEIQKHAKNYRGPKIPSFYKAGDIKSNIIIPSRFIDKVKSRYPNMQYAELPGKNSFIINNLD